MSKCTKTPKEMADIIDVHLLACYVAFQYLMAHGMEPVVDLLASSSVGLMELAKELNPGVHSEVESDG